MELEDFVISKYTNCFYAVDKKGRKKEFENRRFACFIITLKGRICFTAGEKSYISDSEHAIFLPQGLNYVNECIEDAESVVINFLTEKMYALPVSLAAIPSVRAKECYKEIKKASASLSLQSQMLIYKELYDIAYELFSKKQQSTASNSVLTGALEYMMENYHNPHLAVADIAKHCYISEIYLRKLFTKFYGSTPFKMLTDIRMKKAYVLAKEKRPIAEIAEAVGYGAVCQFSRAYKKYYGKSPSSE